MSCLSSCWLYTTPMSRPRSLSSTLLIGHVMGQKRSMKKYTTGLKAAPMARPKRTQMACGRISPKRRMHMVATKTAMAPLLMESSRMETPLLTRVLPRSRVHRRRFPWSRSGRMAAAHLRSFGSPLFSDTCRLSRSRDMSPSVSPLKSPLSASSTTTMTTTAASGSSGGSSHITSSLERPPRTSEAFHPSETASSATLKRQCINR
mmetsp:Transcript_39408/g.84392  ORF Transcript_39408/g.84392 Transcript_39408/m.84392 type:complete len:205 (+) Transcript_39408:346-960(+)